MKLKLSKFSILIIIQLLCVFAFSACSNMVTLGSLERRYGIEIELPKEYKILCFIRGETFTGKAPTYAVIELKEEPTNFLNSFKKVKEDYENNGFGEKYETDYFSNEKNLELKKSIDLHLDCCLSIPNEFYPDWNESYLWKIPTSTNGLTIIYFPNKYKLIFYKQGY